MLSYDVNAEGGAIVLPNIRMSMFSHLLRLGDTGKAMGGAKLGLRHCVA